ncbi:MAG TPA: hypothetical protein VFK86_00945 [Bauldia sp.]|nr:hypothetical protein [Bauldia sp.]
MRRQQLTRVLFKGARAVPRCRSAAPADATARVSLQAIVKILTWQIGYKAATSRGMLETSGARNSLTAPPALFPPATQF